MDTHTDYPLDEYYYIDNYSYIDNPEEDEFHFNASGVCPHAPLHGSNILLPILYCLIFLSGLFGNIFVISVVGCRGRRGGRLVDTFVVNLAVADLVFVLTLPLWAVSARRDDLWDFGAAGDLLCKLSSYIIAVNRSSNIFFLTCMSVDRYLAVVKLLDSRYLRSSSCVRVTCAAVWLTCLALGAPSLLFRKVQPTPAGLSCVENMTSHVFLGLNLAMTLLTFIFPVFIIIICYGTIVAHLHKHCAPAANPRAAARLRHSVKMVLSIIVAFVVSWLPYNVFKVIIVASQLSNLDPICGPPPWQRHGLLVSCCLAFFNSCVNPAIYFFLDHHFRRRAEDTVKTCMGKPKLLHSNISSASFTNAGTSETSGGRSQATGV